MTTPLVRDPRATVEGTGSGSAPFGPGRAGTLARVGVALASFALTLLGLRAVAAPAGGASIGGKLEYWRDHGRDYDTVFVGSSHVLRSFVPAEFDRATSAGGLATHSFNFGVQAVTLLEARYLFERLLEARPGLARVFFEYQWLSPQIDPQNAFNPRTLYWHDAATTALAIERALHWDAELGGLAYVEDPAHVHSLFTVADRLLSGGMRAAEEHAEHFVAHELLIGRGKDVLKGLLALSNTPSAPRARFAEDQGYVSLEDDERALVAQGESVNSYSQRRARFLANLAAFRRDVERLDAEPVSFGDAEWVNAELARVDDFEIVSELARTAAARGVEFVLVILPSQSANRPFEGRLLEELGALVLRYDEPERYRALYDPALRYDSGHLSAEGARRFTRLLAQDYLTQRGKPRDGEPRERAPSGSGVPE